MSPIYWHRNKQVGSCMGQLEYLETDTCVYKDLLQGFSGNANRWGKGELFNSKWYENWVDDLKAST